jgi:hypothetical protein
MFECAEAASCEEKVPPLYMFTARATDRRSLHSMFPRVNHRHANYFNCMAMNLCLAAILLFFSALADSPTTPHRAGHHPLSCWYICPPRLAGVCETGATHTDGRRFIRALR